MAKYKIIPSSRTIVRSPISIGHKAEKGVEAIEFDVTAWVETYGSGTLTVIMRRWGDAIPYPIALEIGEDNKATWTLSDIDTAKAGMAYAQLNYIVGDEVVKKSDIYTFRVMDSLTGEGEPPEAYDSWLEHLTHLAAEAMAEVLDIEGIVTDKTLTVNGGIADAKAAGDALALKADKETTYTKTEVDQMIEDVEVETDTTLEVAGAPADAAETGRQIGLLNESLDDVKADLGAVDDGIKNISFSYTPGYIKSNGTHGSASSTKEVYTNLLSVSAGDELTINLTHTESHEMWVAYALYDTSEVFSGARREICENVEGAEFSDKIIIRTDGYIAFTFRTFDDAVFTCQKPINFIGEINGAIDGIKSELAEFVGYETDLTDKVTWVDKYGQRSGDGGRSTSNYFKITDYIDVSGYDFIEYKMPVYTASSSYGTAFFNESYGYITGIPLVANASELGAVTRIARLSPEIKYMRTSYHRDSLYTNIPCTIKGIKKGSSDYVRPYLADEIADTVAKIKSAQNEPNISFWWFTDIHFRSNNYVVQGRTFLDAVDAVKAMGKYVQMDFILDTGDLHDGNIARATHTTHLTEMLDKLAETKLPVMRSIGNHDTHYSYASNADPYDYKSQFEYYLARTDKATIYNYSTNGTDYYVDFPEFKLRIVNVNTNNAAGGEYKFDKTTTNEWVQNTALNTPDGYDVLFVTHLAPLSRHNKNTSPYGGSAFSTIITGYETETKKLIGIIYGHTHWDATFAEPYLAVASCAHKYADMAEDTTDGAWVYPARSMYDASEQCFNAVIVKPISKVIDVIRFGAGYDRKLHYDLNTVTAEGTLELVPTINAVTWESLDTTICTVSEGTVTGVATGMTGIKAYDTDGNYEMWRISVVN